MSLKAFTNWEFVAGGDGQEVHSATEGGTPDGGSKIVVKILKSRDPEKTRRFQQCRDRQQQAVKAGCTVVVPILEQGEWCGWPYYRMAFYETSIASLGEARRGNARWLFAVAAQLIDTLDELRLYQQTRHGNLKASNLFYVADPSLGTARILLSDFSDQPAPDRSEDLRAFGRILRGLVEGREVSDQVQPIRFGNLVFWRTFGWDAPRWIMTCNFLDSAQHHGRPDAEECLSAMLERIDPCRPYARLKPNVLLLSAVLAMIAAVCQFSSLRSPPRADGSPGASSLEVSTADGARQQAAGGLQWKITPGNLEWEHGEEPKPKEILFELLQDPPADSVTVQTSNENIGGTFETLVDGRKYRLSIRPSQTDQAASSTLMINCRYGKVEKTFRAYAIVKAAQRDKQATRAPSATSASPAVTTPKGTATVVPTPPSDRRSPGSGR